MKLPVRLAATSRLLPGRAVTTTELALRLGRSREEAEQLEHRTGIRSRHVAAPTASWAGLAAQVIRDALQRASFAATDLERIIFVTSSAGDVLVPANANSVALELGAQGSCDCFDLNNACMGFLTAFDITARSIATGGGATAIAAVELGSRYITPAEPRPYLVFGDAAAAAILVPPRAGGAVLGSWLRNDASLGGDVTLTHPGVSGRREYVHFNSSNKQMIERAVELLQTSAREVLAQAGLRLEDVDWVLPHQPNGALLQTVIAALALPPDRVVPVVGETGSLASASIPYSLDVLMRSDRTEPGDRVLMVGVGAGVSAGAILLELP